MTAISIKELHRTTGDYVRWASSLKAPVVVTDRGKPVAILGSLSLLKARRRKRTLLPDFEKLMTKKPGTDLAGDLDAVRGDR